MDNIQNKLLAYLKKHDEVTQDVEKQGRTGTLSPGTLSRLKATNIEIGDPRYQTPSSPSSTPPPVTAEPKIRRKRTPKKTQQPLSQDTPPSAPSASPGYDADAQPRGRSWGGGMHPGGGGYPSKPGAKSHQAVGSMHPGGRAYAAKQLLSLSLPEKTKLVQLLDFLRGYRN